MAEDVGGENVGDAGSGDSEGRLAAGAARVHHEVVDRFFQALQRGGNRGQIGHIQQEDLKNRLAGSGLQLGLSCAGLGPISAGQANPPISPCCR